ncbi:ras-like protein [Anaeramoeba ignava]|uniref:small monomeric GTPase n=1 Tax=Anaeramoeba ignava TaxID=1746090 RepID=A0A9Q0LVI0_ANAIG|nr:ras-like protein [Anaeramoeba ignava]|eukprot:Anaeramoba_ignava/a629879_81.p1 GENE.a629879_81~~a629879_81.p1  ORF type:complete len:189 (-),score=44.23 a629879_81:60-626(-)
MSKYKVVIVGSGGVGKSAITMQFIQSKFVEDYDPTVEDSYRKQIVVENEKCLLDIADTAGQEEFGPLRSVYLRAGEGFVMVFSIVEKNTFEEIKMLKDQIVRIKDVESIHDIPLILVGNKSDLEDKREVTQQQMKELADSWDCPFFETSAKNNSNIDECFQQIVKQIKKVREKLGLNKPVKKTRCTIL